MITRLAENTLLDLEELDQAELDRMRKRYEELARMAREQSEARQREPAREHSRRPHRAQRDGQQDAEPHGEAGDHEQRRD